VPRAKNECRVNIREKSAHDAGCHTVPNFLDYRGIEVVRNILACTMLCTVLLIIAAGRYILVEIRHTQPYHRLMPYANSAIYPLAV
jgi:hypothetical protein